MIDGTYADFESYSPTDDLVLCDEPTSVRAPEGGFTCRMLKSLERARFAEQEAELRRPLGTLPVARLSIDRSGIGMNLAGNLSRAFPQVELRHRVRTRVARAGRTAPGRPLEGQLTTCPRTWALG